MNQQILSNCKELLINYSNLRELVNIREAIWKYWETFCGVGDYLQRRDFLSSRLPHPETLAGAFRTIKRNYPELKGSISSQQMSRENKYKVREQLGYSGLTPSYHQGNRELELERQRRMGID